MSFSAARSAFMLSKLLPNNRALLTNSISKSVFNVGQLKNTRTLTRSLFFMCRKRDSEIGNVSERLTWSNKCSCGCSLHTKGDQELAAFLADEIENEMKARASPDLPSLGDFQVEFSGAEVTLTKKIDNEIITIKANVNNSVDAEESVVDPNETKEPQEAEMKAKPEFTIEIQKAKKIMSFLCTYSHAMPDEESSEAYNDAFQISEVSLYEGEYDDSTYSVSGDIMDGYLYDLLMNYLEERGISNDFADKMVAFFTAYEHKLYISLLQGMKSFVEKK